MDAPTRPKRRWLTLVCLAVPVLLAASLRPETDSNLVEGSPEEVRAVTLHGANVLAALTAFVLLDLAFGPATGLAGTLLVADLLFRASPFAGDGPAAGVSAISVAAVCLAALAASLTRTPKLSRKGLVAWALTVTAFGRVLGEAAVAGDPRAARLGLGALVVAFVFSLAGGWRRVVLVGLPPLSAGVAIVVAMFWYGDLNRLSEGVKLRPPDLPTGPPGALAASLVALGLWAMVGRVTLGRPTERQGGRVSLLLALGLPLAGTDVLLSLVWFVLCATFGVAGALRGLGRSLVLPPPPQPPARPDPEDLP